MSRSRTQAFKAAAAYLLFPTRFDAAHLFDRLTIAAVGMSVLTLGMLLLDGRTLADEHVWLKPFKFAISFTVLFATLGFVTKRFSHFWRTNWILVASAVASAAAFAFEMAYIAAQAARAEASHFNESTPFHEMMYALMGTGATALMTSIAIVGLAAFADGEARLGPKLRLGIVSGFILTVLLTTWVAGELAGNGGRYIGIPTADGPRIPLVGWSMEVGDLRPAHFLALHAMQVLPATGYLADRFRLPARWVWIASVLYAIFTTMVFLKALQGAPLISA